ncbi:hypothetical protein GC173_02210 [bacterium]|nr:hypothetical protein [bacterium]
MQKVSFCRRASLVVLFGLMLSATASAQFASPVEISNPLPNAPRHVETEDFDGDGDLDLVVLSSNDGRIRYYENRLGGLEGDFAPEVVVSTQVSGGGTGLVSADIDGDGDLDILYDSQTSQEIAWFENRFAEDGGFGPRQVISTGNGYTRYPDLVDIDGDGALDVVVINGTAGNSLRFWRNRLDESEADFAPFVDQVTGLTNVFAFKFVDLDMDGDLDLVVTSDNASTLYWMENLDGAGAFGSAQTLVTKAELSNTQAYDILLEDLDGDDQPDILFSGQVNDLKWIRNQLHEVSANFSTPSVVTTGVTFPSRFTQYDIDGDGFRDVVFIESFTSSINYVPNRLQTVDANFGSLTTLETVSSGPQDLVFRDLDADGDTDIMVLSLGTPRVGFIKNQTFDPTPAIAIDTPTSPALELLFGTVELGATPTVRSAVFSDPGTADLNTTITLSVNPSNQFQFQQLPPAIMNRLTTGTLEIALIPTTLGSISGEVSVETNTSSGTLTIALSGLGVDTIAPTSSVTAPASGPLSQPDGDLSIEFLAADSGSGVADVELFYTLNGGSPTSLGVFTSSPISVDASPLGGSGTYGFYTRARDVANNVEDAPVSPDVTVVLSITTAISDWSLLTD